MRVLPVGLLRTTTASGLWAPFANAPQCTEVLLHARGWPEHPDIPVKGSSVSPKSKLYKIASVLLSRVRPGIFLKAPFYDSDPRRYHFR